MCSSWHFCFVTPDWTFLARNFRAALVSRARQCSFALSHSSCRTCRMCTGSINERRSIVTLQQEKRCSSCEERYVTVANR